MKIPLFESFSICILILISGILVHVLVLCGDTCSYYSKDYPPDVSLLMAIDSNYNTNFHVGYSEQYYPKIKDYFKLDRDYK